MAAAAEKRAVLCFMISFKKGKLDAAVEIGKAYALTEELEKQVEKLNGEVEAQIKQKEALEHRLSESEKKINALIMKHDKIEKSIEEQKSKIRKTERVLKVAEDELMKAKLEASKIKELIKVHAAWLPTWLASYWSQFQSFIEMHWNDNGKPAMNMIIQKAVERKAQAEEWATPHVEKMKTIQGNFEETLKRHDLTQSLATEASALLALPAIILFKFLSAHFSTKSRRPARGSHKTHARRKAKRGHPDK